jgi:hypothetical protein
MYNLHVVASLPWSNLFEIQLNGIPVAMANGYGNADATAWIIERQIMETGVVSMIGEQRSQSHD